MPGIRHSITTRLITLLILCSTVTLGAGIALDYQLSRQEILQRLQQESSDTIAAALTNLDNLLDGVAGGTLFLGRILQQREYSREGLEQMLRELVAWNPDVYGATIALNPDFPGQEGGFAPYYYHRDGELMRVDLSGADRTYTREAWYRDTVASNAPRWVEPYFDLHGGQVLMTTFAVPVYRSTDAGERSLYAVVTADIALSELDDYLQHLQLGTYGASLLLSREGTVLSSRDPNHIMRHYRDIVATDEGMAQWQPLFEQALAGEQQSLQIPCPQAPGACSLRLAPLQATGWPVAVLLSQQELLAPLHTFGIKTALSGLASLLVMALAVTLVTRRITRPLGRLAAASANIAAGQLDTPLPPAGRADEVGRLIDSFAAMTRDLKSYISDLEAATRSRSRLEGELAAAHQIQMSMLPGGGDALEATQDYTLCARLRPAKSVGGDLYSFRREGDTLAFAVGDVSDKGVPAALFMAKAIGQLEQMRTTAGPAAAMAALNDLLTAGNDNCMFLTLFLGQLDLTTGQLHYCSAGHPPPLLLRSGRVIPAPQESGPALGLRAQLRFPACSLQLTASERLALYTDGIDEAFNSQREMFSVPRLIQCLQEQCGSSLVATADAVFNAVDTFAVDTPQSDDITLLLLQLPPQTIDSALACSAEFAIGPLLVSRTLNWLHDASPLLKPDHIAADELCLLLEEIVANIDSHGGLESGAHISVQLSAAPGGVALQVSDPGRPFDPLQQAQRSALGQPSTTTSVGGLGVHLITQLSDEQRYRREAGRNILSVIKRQ